MIVPKKGEPFQLYLTSTNKSIGRSITQEEEGVEKPVYYMNQMIHGPKVRYSTIERIT